MDLNSEINIELKECIEKNYNNESYSAAIKDSIILLSDVIRNKTGLEGDGAALIGQAFGGNSPKIKLNNLQTDSDKNIQKGMQDLLRGIYSAIRNPRNHDKVEDSKKDADAIILFINYLLKMINKSKLSFEMDAFSNRIFDSHYVITEEYSDLIVKEIPNRQKADVAIRVLLKRIDGNIYALSSFMHSLFKLLSVEEIERIYEVVSDELKFTTDHADIRTIIKILPGGYWNKVDKVVKLRIENILLNDLKQGEYFEKDDQCGSFGALATWLSEDHIERFEKSVDITYEIVKKLRSENIAEVKYVEKYLWSKICDANKANINFWLKDYFIKALENCDLEIIIKLESKITCEEDHPWWEVFKENLKKYPEIKYDAFF